MKHSHQGVFSWFGTTFRNLKIRNKIIFVFVPLILLPIVVMLFATNKIFTNAIVSKTILNIRDNAWLVINRIETIVGNSESCANIITIGIDRVLSLRSPQAVEKGDVKVFIDIYNQLCLGLLIFPDVDSAIFIDTQGIVNSSNPRILKKTGNPLDDPLLKAVENTYGTNIWFPMQKRDYWVTEKEAHVLTLGKKIVNIDTGLTVGYLLLNVKESTVFSVYNGINAKTSLYFILDEYGTLISPQENEQMGEGVSRELLAQISNADAAAPRVVRLNGHDFLVTSNLFQRFPWKLVSRTDVRELSSDNRTVNLILFLVGGICLVLSLIGAAILSFSIATPVSRLSRHMLESNLRRLPHYGGAGSKDEIGLLASAFNIMTTRMNDLMRRVRRVQAKKREFELALIQAQIKPHFLYNTLEIICALIDMRRDKEAWKATKSLSDYYRIALNGGREIVTVEEEIANVTSYLYIQRMRYSDVFDFEIGIDPAILHCSILKLTIQPLVENAIYHGLKPKIGFGRVKISGAKEEGHICITVSDDGVGISRERLDEVLIRKSRRDGTHFGLSSVSERIKLFFGPDYGLEIRSALGEGTTINVRIPVRRPKNRELSEVAVGN